VLKPTHCRGCGESLCGDDTAPLRHQVWELPVIKPLVTEYQRHRLECPCCGTATTAVLPSGVPSGQTGPRLVAFAALLMAYFRQSKRRTAEFVETLLGAPCSTGLTIKHQTIATEALSSCYEELKEALPDVEAANLDETGSKEAGRKAWLWVAVTTGFTLFAVRLTRAGKVVRELLGERFAGFLTTDRYGAYNGYSKRQICSRASAAGLRRADRPGQSGQTHRTATEERRWGPVPPLGSLPRRHNYPSHNAPQHPLVDVADVGGPRRRDALPARADGDVVLRSIGALR